jgi:hypothetical protein
VADVAAGPSARRRASGPSAGQPQFDLLTFLNPLPLGMIFIW